MRTEGGCVVELKAVTPCAGLLPVTHGAMTLTEVEVGTITALMPFSGQEAALSKALMAAHGMVFPGPGQVCNSVAGHCVWTARGQAFLIGPAPDPALQSVAAVTDQSDAWAVVQITGEGAEDALARLIPIDLRPAAFPVGTSARTLCQHMTVSVCRLDEGVRIMAFRSMARTLAHEIADAMASVAARQVAG
jgi:sarcosine oxidase subunit gamma